MKDAQVITTGDRGLTTNR